MFEELDGICNVLLHCVHFRNCAFLECFQTKKRGAIKIHIYIYIDTIFEEH